MKRKEGGGPDLRANTRRAVLCPLQRNAIGFHLQRSAQNHFWAAKAMFSQAAREVL